MMKIKNPAERTPNQQLRNAPPAYLPIASPSSHTFAKAKRSQNAISDHLMYQLPIAKPQNNAVSLQCNEVLDHFCNEQTKQNMAKIKLEEYLLCQQQLVSPKTQNLPISQVFSRMQNVLQTYQSLNSHLLTEKQQLYLQNIRLRQQLTFLMTYFKK